jgi:hypothetical protein
MSTAVAPADSSDAVLGQGAGYLFVAHHNVLIASWTAQGTGPLIATLAQVLASFVAAHPEGISSVHLVAAGLPLANLEAREGLKEIMMKYAGNLACAGTVLAGTGFWASATRGMLVGLQLLAPSSHALRTCATVPELVAWLPKPHAERTGITLDPLAFGRAILETRERSIWP